MDIPINILFKALGCITDKEILYHIIDNDNSYMDGLMLKIIRKSFTETSNCKSEYEAIMYITKYINHSNTTFSPEMKYEYCKNILKRDLLPHLGDDDKKKIHFLGLMVNKLLKCYIGAMEPSNRDDYANKRIETVGILMGNLINQCMYRIVKDIRLFINKEVSTGLWTLNNNYEDIINDNKK